MLLSQFPFIYLQHCQPKLNLNNEEPHFNCMAHIDRGRFSWVCHINIFGQKLTLCIQICYMTFRFSNFSLALWVYIRVILFLNMMLACWVEVIWQRTVKIVLSHCMKQRTWCIWTDSLLFQEKESKEMKRRWFVTKGLMQWMDRILWRLRANILKLFTSFFKFFPLTAGIWIFSELLKQ